MKKLSLLLCSSVFAVSAAYASSDQKHPKHMDWAFDGAFGRVDKPAAQRGLQVYKEVCAACHGLHRVAFRSLTDIGFSEAEVKALAANYTIQDGPNDAGEMFERPGKPFDKFPSPFPNDKAAAAAHNGAAPPDLSLMVKARPNGANYIYSLLTGYGEAVPEHVQITDGQHYNPYFPGGKLAMPAPLSDGQVNYEDGSTASVDQMAKDVVTFLQWAAEPEMEQRKHMGIKVMLYLAVFSVFAYIAKKRIWSKIH